MVAEHNSKIRVDDFANLILQEDDEEVASPDHTPVSETHAAADPVPPVQGASQAGTESHRASSPGLDDLITKRVVSDIQDLDGDAESRKDIHDEYQQRHSRTARNAQTSPRFEADPWVLDD